MLYRYIILNCITRREIPVVQYNHYNYYAYILWAIIIAKLIINILLYIII